MNSLSVAQKIKLQKYFTTGMEGPILWMYIVAENQLVSSRALHQVIKDLEFMKLSSYPGENVKSCTSSIDDKCHHLEAGTKLPEDVGVTICDILMKCSIKEFRIPFINKCSELNFNPYTELIYLADLKYQSLLDAQLWVHQPMNKDVTIAGLVAKVGALTLLAKFRINKRRQEGNS